jgi:hypothetical protein
VPRPGTPIGNFQRAINGEAGHSAASTGEGDEALAMAVASAWISTGDYDAREGEAAGDECEGEARFI